MTTASINNHTVFHGKVHSKSSHGFVALGADSFGLADFDNFSIKAKQSQ